MAELALVPVLAERLPRIADMPPFTAGPPDPDAIAAFEAFGAPVGGYARPDVDVVDAVAPGPHGDVPVRIYCPPAGTATRGLVWVHGGGFVAGDLDMPESDVVARELTARANMVVVAVDYRLCVGGVHFPVPHDDVHAAVVWAATSSDLLPSGARWALGGASAGGNLAAGVAQRCRDEGTVVPDALVLAYAVVHDPVPDADDEQSARLEVLPAVLRFPAEARTFINRNFLGEHDSDVPYAFAGRGDVRDFPRTHIIVCEFDDLAPSGQLFAQQLGEAGVDVELEVVLGVPHGHLNIQGLTETLHSIDGIVGFLARQKERT
jgi:acetyl esterase